LVLIAKAVFLLERRQTDRQTNEQTDATERPPHAGGNTASVGNKKLLQYRNNTEKGNNWQYCQQEYLVTILTTCTAR